MTDAVYIVCGRRGCKVQLVHHDPEREGHAFVETAEFKRAMAPHRPKRAPQEKQKPSPRQRYRRAPK